MTSILAQLKTIASDLHALATPWALVGGLAVSVHAEPRTTRDIDIAVAIADKNLQMSLIESLLKQGYRNEQTIVHLAPTHTLGVRLQVRGPAIDSVAVDLLFSSSGIEAEIVASAITIEVFPDFMIPVVCLGHLIAMKLLAQNNDDRLRDRADLRELLARASLEDAAIASDALSLMTVRGFSRGKELLSEYSQALQDFAPQLARAFAAPDR